MLPNSDLPCQIRLFDTGALEFSRDLLRRLKGFVPARLAPPVTNDWRDDVDELLQVDGQEVRCYSRAHRSILRRLSQSTPPVQYRAVPLEHSAEAIICERMQKLNASPHAGETLSSFRFGQIVCSRSSEISVIAADLAMGFPSARVHVLVLTREECRSFRQALENLLSEPVGVAFGSGVAAEHRVTVRTYAAGIDVINGTVLILPFTGTHMSQALAKIHRFRSPARCYLLRTGRRLSTAVELELLHRFGDILLDHRPQQGELTLSALRFGNVKGRRPPRDFQLNKRSSIWRHRLRNDAIATLASEMAADSDAGTIWVVVETPEHGLELQGPLDKWPLITASAWDTPLEQAIVTSSAIALDRRVKPPTRLVYAAGGPPSAWFTDWLDLRLRDGNSIHVVECRDAFNATSAWFAERRLAQLFELGGHLRPLPRAMVARALHGPSSSDRV